jgi:voltage-dependent anion channel protein 2
MVVPVKFGDIGKAANDLLGKDYPVGQVKLEVKTFATNGVVSIAFTKSFVASMLNCSCFVQNFTVNGNKDNKSGAIFGELKTKFVDKPNGKSSTQVEHFSPAWGVDSWRGIRSHRDRVLVLQQRSWW